MPKRKRRKRTIESTLNLTNMIDVIFALLIIFMITAPMMTQGVQVNLPRADAENMEIDQTIIEIAITKKNEIYIDKKNVALNKFGTEFRNVFQNRFDTPIYVSADKEVPYGLFVKVISEVQKSGGVKLGFLTEPLEKE
ncbi:MAG: biopolymer transporter ExbD [Chitinispirillales bacterium]|jgi:biopolymer transport protein ExbD|nr:biopolymer transporter ExbD [Chitinispirillales bacterium]